MYKNFKLTDEERKQIMEMHQSRGYRKPLTEDMDSSVDMEIPKEETPADKVEDVVNSNPKFQNSIDAIIAALSDEEKAELQNALSSHGITASSSAEEVHNIISQPKEGNEQEVSELFFYDKDKGASDKPQAGRSMKEIRNKVADIMHSVGAGNIGAWGGLPAAVVIGSMTGVATGLAISWGASAVLMALAKALNPDIDKMNESEQEISESRNAFDAEKIAFHSGRLVRALQEFNDAKKREQTRRIEDVKPYIHFELREIKNLIEELERSLRRL